MKNSTLNENKHLLSIFVSIPSSIKQKIYKINKQPEFVDLRNMDIRFKDYRNMLLKRCKNVLKNKVYFKTVCSSK